MTDKIESKGKTVEEAVNEALLRMGARKDEVKIEVLDEPKNGLFGIIGSKSARVLVTKKQGRGGQGRRDFRDRNEDSAAHNLSDNRNEAGRRSSGRGGSRRRPSGGRSHDRSNDRNSKGNDNTQARRQDQPREARSDNRNEARSDSRGAGRNNSRGRGRNPRRDEQARQDQPRQDHARQDQAQDRPQQSERQAASDRPQRRDRTERTGRSRRNSRGPRPDRKPVNTKPVDGNTVDAPVEARGNQEQRQDRNERNDRGGRSERGRNPRNERNDRNPRGRRPRQDRDNRHQAEGDSSSRQHPAANVERDMTPDEVILTGIQAIKYADPMRDVGEENVDQALSDLTNGLLIRAGFPIRCEVMPGEYRQVRITTDDSSAGMLIGRHGSTVDSIEHLVERMAGMAVGDRVRLNLDINNYRRRREESLHERSIEAAGIVRENGRTYHMEPMSPRERRIVHLQVEGMEGVRTFTMGGAGGKHVVLAPDNDNKGERPAKEELPELDEKDTGTDASADALVDNDFDEFDDGPQPETNDLVIDDGDDRRLI